MIRPRTTLEREFAENYDRIADAFRRFIRTKVAPGAISKQLALEVVEEALKCGELIRIEKEIGHRFFRQWFYREHVPTKAGPPRSRRDRDLFDLDEMAVVDGETLPRRHWYREFMQQIRQQKVLNITVATHALQLFDFECQQIFPWFDIHPDWKWIDAYNAIVWRDGAFP